MIQPNVSLIPNVLIQDLIKGSISVEEFVWSELLFLGVDVDAEFDLNEKLDYGFSERCKTYLSTGKMPASCQEPVTMTPVKPVVKPVVSSPTVKKSVHPVKKSSPALSPEQAPGYSRSPEQKAQLLNEDDMYVFSAGVRLFFANILNSSVNIPDHQMSQLAGLCDGNLEYAKLAIEKMAQSGANIKSPVGYLITILRNNTYEDLKAQAETVQKKTVVSEVYESVQERIKKGEFDIG